MAQYEIILRNETTEDEGTPVAEPTPNNESNQPKKNPKVKTKGQEMVTAGLVAWNTVKPWISQTVSHQINTVELRTGKKEYAERTQMTYSIVNDVLGIGESALAGYAVGNIPGAVIGAITGLGHTILGYAQKQETINIQNSLENIVLQQNRIRAGVGGSRRV